MARLKVPIISVVIGEGGSGGALALAVSDRVWMLENSIYSILSPEGFASILWKDSKRAKEAAEVMKITADDLLELGIIEKIIEEPNGGAHNSSDEISGELKKNFIKELEELQKLDKEVLIENRYSRYRKQISE
jgi:acetyl-CoA carboxylase carboxyl transferase subunit alpha